MGQERGREPDSLWGLTHAQPHFHRYGKNDSTFFSCFVTDLDPFFFPPMLMNCDLFPWMLKVFISQRCAIFLLGKNDVAESMLFLVN